MVQLSGVLSLGDGSVAETAKSIAAAKVALGPIEAFMRGVLCNTLVCLAVWMCFAAHTVAGKVQAIVLPITAFVALGFGEYVLDTHRSHAVGKHSRAAWICEQSHSSDAWQHGWGQCVGGTCLLARLPQAGCSSANQVNPPLPARVGLLTADCAVARDHARGALDNTMPVCLCQPGDHLD